MSALLLHSNIQRMYGILANRNAGLRKKIRSAAGIANLILTDRHERLLDISMQESYMRLFNPEGAEPAQSVSGDEKTMDALFIPKNILDLLGELVNLPTSNPRISSFELHRQVNQVLHWYLPLIRQSMNFLVAANNKKRMDWADRFGRIVRCFRPDGAFW